MSLGKLIYMFLIASATVGCIGRFKLHRRAVSAEAPASVGVAAPPKAPGNPKSFALNDAIGVYGIATWESAGQEDDGSALAKQQVLLYGDGDTTCSGSIAATHDVAADATTFQWDRLVSNIPGTVRFRVRSVSQSNQTADSDCSNTVALRNGPGIIAGPKANLHLGKNYLKLADVTGDGIDDIITWDSAYNNGRGYIAVLPGGENPAKNTLLLYEGSIDGDNLAVTYVIDLNKDGIKDIVGYSATAAPGGIVDAGSIYVILGSKTLPNSGTIESVGRRYDGVTASDRLGSYLKYGDTNGDGYLELIGAYEAAGPASGGSIYLIPGSATMPASGAITSIGYRYDAIGADGLGWGALSIEDITGDNKAEILAVGPMQSTGFVFSGALFVIPGAATFPASGNIDTVARRYNGGAANDQLGVNINFTGQIAASDITGDGLKDIVVGGGGMNLTVFVVSGQATMPASGTIGVVAGTRRYTGVELFHIYNTNFADVTGDNVTDLVYGGLQNAYVLPSGALPANGTVAAQWRRYTGVSNVGVWAKTTMVDVTGDGVKDIIVGDSQAAGGGTLRGSTYVITGGAIPASTTLAAASARRYDGDSNNDAMRVVTAFDVTGDGIADLIGVSDLADPGGITDAGSICVIAGAATLPTTGTVSTAGRRYDGTRVEDRLGFFDAFIDVDLNADGIRDLVTSTSSADPGGVTDSGSVFAILGAATLPTSGPITTAGLRFDGKFTNHGFGAIGTEQSPVVDIDRDGFQDLIFGHVTTASGIYAISGSKTLSSTTSIKAFALESAGDPKNIGYNFQYADITGDNKKDLISFGHNGTDAVNLNGLSNSGAIYFINGALLK